MVVEPTRGDEVRLRVLGSDNDGDGTLDALELLDTVRACELATRVKLVERGRVAERRAGEDEGEVVSF